MSQSLSFYLFLRQWRYVAAAVTWVFSDMMLIIVLVTYADSNSLLDIVNYHEPMYVRPQRQRMNLMVSKMLSRRKSLRSSITAGLRISTRKPVMSATLSGGIVTSMEVTHCSGSDPDSAWRGEKMFNLCLNKRRENPEILLPRDSINC